MLSCSEVSGEEFKEVKLAATGVGVGGSGGRAEGRVEVSHFQALVT